MRGALLIWLLAAVAISAVTSDEDAEIARLIKAAEEDSTDLFEALLMDDIDKGTDDDDKKRPSNDIEEEDSWDAQSEGDGTQARSGGKSKLKSFFTSKIAPKADLSNIQGKFKGFQNAVSNLGKKGWAQFKTQFKKGKNAGKKMIKSVLKDLYEQGKEEALEIMKAAILEWIDEKLQENFCECFSNQNNLTRKCRCCINFPGLKRACLKVEAKLRTQSFDVSLKYEGREFVKAFMVTPKVLEKRSVCSARSVGEEPRSVCANLPYELHFMDVCIEPGDVEISNANAKGKGDFSGCFQIRIGRLELSWEVCVQFDRDEKALSFVSIF